MSKAFLKVMTDIKRQKAKEEKRKEHSKPQQKELEEDLSSNEEKRLAKLGVLKKKIKKPQEKPERQWRHDKFNDEAPVNEKQYKEINIPTIVFEGQPGYSKIFPIVKHIKIHIREIDDNSIVFNSMEAFLEAKKLFYE